MTLPNRLDLRTVLLVDAAACGALALLLLAGAGFLDSWLNLSRGFLWGVGLVLGPWALLLVVVATRAAIRLAAAWGIVIVNVVWVIASMLMLLMGWKEPNALGVAFVTVQAIAAAMLTGCEVGCLVRDGSRPGMARA